MAEKKTQREIAHELKTPLTAIFGYAQLLKSKLDGKSKEGEWVKTIIEETKRLEEMIDTLLR